MTILEMMKKLEECGDISVDYEYNITDNGIPIYEVIIEDFDGFDDNWEEVGREFNQPKLVEKFENALEEQALKIVGHFYFDYYFKDFIINLGYGSYDI